MKKIFSVVICIVAAVAIIVSATVIKGYIDDPTENPVRSVIQTVPAKEITNLGSPVKFYYNKLSDLEKHAYNRILSEIYDMPEEISIPPVTAEQFDNVFSALLSDNPDLFFVGRRCSLSSGVLNSSCTIEYIINREEYAEKKLRLESVCKEVIASLTNPEDDWQTELEIHDYIIENCKYKLEENNLILSSSYGVLVDGEAACEGYSKAAKLLFDKAGIECVVLSGTSENFDGSSEPHMWNVVKIHGDYYYLDCTWDDPVTENGEDKVAYSYFNLNDEVISATHSDFLKDFNCTATAANYYVKTGKYFSSYSSDDITSIAKLTANELNSGKKLIEIRFATKDVYDKAIKDLIDGGRIYDVLLQAKKQTEINISVKEVTYYADETRYILAVVPQIE